ncbi:MAG: hypothetical protein K2N26_00690 [Oscillospiraceae bacterium]|nr:hypothetical protein [Oscillospiraceae bacterium]
MKKMATKVLAVLTACALLICFSACSGGRDMTISVNTAESRMETYLESKGFGEDDFLSESDVMVIEGEEVYVFSWRVKEGENADRLFGMYAISLDGKSYYEYQEARGEWIKDMNASEE